MMRKWMCALLACLMLCGCAKGKGPADDEPLDIGGTGAAEEISRGRQAAGAAPMSSDEIDIATSPQGGASGKLVVDDVVAYAFDGTLYGGFTYTNTGGGPMHLTGAELKFTYDGKEHIESYQPFTGVDDVVLPGETACATLFAPLGEQISSPGELSLSVTLSAQAAQVHSTRLEVDDARLIQNYPGFATLSARLVNNSQEQSRLCMVYVQFYDEAGALIGIWYFTLNALLQPGQDTAFVVHVQTLPIEGLADRTASMRFRAFRL